MKLTFVSVCEQLELALGIARQDVGTKLEIEIGGVYRLGGREKLL